jgi:hypothetical protein
MLSVRDAPDASREEKSRRDLISSVITYGLNIDRLGGRVNESRYGPTGPRRSREGFPPAS